MRSHRIIVRHKGHASQHGEYTSLEAFYRAVVAPVATGDAPGAWYLGWHVNAGVVTKAFTTSEKITAVTLDPAGETADTDLANNTWPWRSDQSRFQRFKGESKP